jgi:hypothetical protein
MAPRGIIEFIPKHDPMIMGLLSNRQDIYYDYDEVVFRRAVLTRGRIESEHRFEENDRLLIAYSTE